MYLAIFLTIFLILVNGFFLGKIFKRFKPTLNLFYTLLFGTVTYLGSFAAITIPLFLFVISAKFIFIYFLIFQIVLILIYILNWRWFFITYKIDYKKVIFFIIVAICIFLGWLFTRSLATNKDWLFTLDNNTINFFTKINGVNLDSVIVLNRDFSFQVNLIDNFLLGIIYIGNFFDAKELSVFYNIFSLFIIIYIGSLALCSIYNKRETNKFNFILFFLGVFAFSTIIFSFPTYVNIILFSLVLLLVHFNAKNINQENISIIVVNFIVFCGFNFDSQFVLIAVLINLLFTTISYQTKYNNATNYNILMLLSTILSFAVTFNNVYYISLIMLVAFLLFYIAFFLFKTSSIFNKVMYKVDQFLYRNISFLIILLSFLILIAAIILFFTTNVFNIQDVWVLDERIFPTYVSTITTSINVKSIYIILNVFFWMVNIAIFTYSLFTNSFISFKQFNSNAMSNFSLLAITIFWNPFFTMLLVRFFSLGIMSITFDLTMIFWITLIPLYLRWNQYVFESKKLSLNKMISMGIIISVLSTFITFKNVI